VHRGEIMTPHRFAVDVKQEIGGEKPWDGRLLSREKSRSRKRSSRGAQGKLDLATDPERLKRDGRGALNSARLHG